MAHYHFLGIAGAFMAGAARLAAELGHQISGSDRAFYPPFGEEAHRTGATLHTDYQTTVQERPADCYIIGNAISRGNPLLESILRTRRPFLSAPQFLHQHILPGRRPIAIAGTHGKTTTASLTVHLLDTAGAAPGFLVGGILPTHGLSARLSPSAAPFVCEADEYDTAFFDKRPKFLHLHPHIAVLNNLEYDHADIYPDIEAIIRQFHYLIRTIPDNGTLLVRTDDANLATARAMGCHTPVQLFGPHPASLSKNTDLPHWTWRYHRGAMQIYRRGVPCGGAFIPPLAGAANRDNITAAIAASTAAGADPTRAGAHLQSYRPPLRRLQCIHDRNDIRIYDDFAHHPTAIAKTIAALAELRTQRPIPAIRGKLIAAFEPRSNTMRAGVFQNDWQTTLAQADAVVAVGTHPWLKRALSSCTPPPHLTADATTAATLITAMAGPGDDILLMSNGDFDNLAETLKTTLP